MAIRLFVGNLPPNVTEAELREHFSTVGPLSYISVPTDRESGRQRGFAFVEFKDAAQANEAIRYLNNKSFKGSSLSIKEARARDDKGPARPAFVRDFSPAEPDIAAANRPKPNFGADAPPSRGRGKTKRKLNSERAPKAPMREVVRGQFFGDHDDDDDFDDFDDVETVEANEEKMTEQDNDLEKD